MGTVCVIRQATRLPGDRVRVFVAGQYRAVARNFRLEKTFLIIYLKAVLAIVFRIDCFR